jgi:hypothetical protein
MKKKGKNSITPARTTIASVKKEMQMPRLTESVRNDGQRLAILVTKQPAARPARAGFLVAAQASHKKAVL